MSIWVCDHHSSCGLPRSGILPFLQGIVGTVRTPNFFRAFLMISANSFPSGSIKINTSELSDILELLSLTSPILFLLHFRISFHTSPDFGPQMIRSGCCLPFRQSPSSRTACILLEAFPVCGDCAWSLCALILWLWCLRATHRPSPPRFGGTGVLWVSTGTHPCGPSPMQNGEGYQSASSCCGFVE